MLDLTFDFTWYKHAQGYRLIEAKPIPRKRGQSLLDATFGDVQPARIVPKGGPLLAYRPLDDDKLFERFTREATSEVGLLSFMNKFGPLTNDGLRKGGEVALEIINEAKGMPGTVGAALNPLRAAIVRANDGRVRLKVSPACLLDALWLQFAQAQTNGVTFRQCENKKCGKPFIAGVAGNRRGDARFCSDECRIRHNSLERSRR